MSKGPGSAERAILEATARALSPLGARKWLTLVEVWQDHTGTDPTEDQLKSLRRAKDSLAAKGAIEIAKAGERLALFSAQIRQDVRRGSLLVRSVSTTLKLSPQVSEQDVSGNSTEYIGEARKTGRALLRGMVEAPLDDWRGQWDYRPTAEQETEAGQWASEKKPYGYNDLRKPLVNKGNGEYHYDTRNTGSDWSSDDDRRAGQAPEAYLAARNRVGIRGGPLRTQSVMRLAPAEGKTPKELDDEGQIPSRGERARPFTNEELRGWELLN